MDFNDSPEEAAFRKEVRAWLDANATRKSAAQSAAPLDEVGDRFTLSQDEALDAAKRPLLSRSSSGHF